MNGFQISRILQNRCAFYVSSIVQVNEMWSFDDDTTFNIDSEVTYNLLYIAPDGRKV